MAGWDQQRRVALCWNASTCKMQMLGMSAECQHCQMTNVVERTLDPVGSGSALPHWATLAGGCNFTALVSRLPLDLEHARASRQSIARDVAATRFNSNPASSTHQYSVLSTASISGQIGGVTKRKPPSPATHRPRQVGKSSHTVNLSHLPLPTNICNTPDLRPCLYHPAPGYTRGSCLELFFTRRHFLYVDFGPAPLL